MTAIIQQLKKDILRLRIYLVVWSIPLVLALLGQLGILHPTHSGSSMIGLSSILMFFIVPILIHEDPLVGSSAFWLTRPVSNGQLLVEKAFFLGLMVVLMTAGRAMEFVSLKMSAEETFVAALYALVKSTAGVSYLALAATLTRNFKGYVLYAVLGLFGLGLVTGFSGLVAQVLFCCFMVITGKMDSFFERFNPFQYSSTIAFFGGNQAQDMLVLPVIFLVAALLIGHQYLTRRSSATLSLGVAVASTATVIHTIFLLVVGMKSSF